MQADIENLLDESKDLLTSCAKTIYDKLASEGVVEFKNKNHWLRAICEVLNQQNISILYEESNIDAIFDKNYKEGNWSFDDFLNSIVDILGMLLNKSKSNVQLQIENPEITEPKINIDETPSSYKGIETPSQGNFEYQEISNEPSNVFEAENFDEIENPDELKASSYQDKEKINQNTEAVIKIKKYLDDTGLYSAFQLIFAEILSRKIEPNDAFSYAATRLRQIGKEVSHLLPQEYTAEKTIES